MSVTAPSAPAGHVRRWTPEAPEVSASLILRLQRYRDLSQVPGAVRVAAEEIAHEARRLATPEAAIWRGPVTSVAADGAVTLGGDHRFHSRALARLLAGSREAYVVVLTVGAGIEERVREVLVNLVSNALKAAPPRTEVDLSVRRAQDGFVAFSVTDRGKGIPPDKIGLLFQKFQQLDGANTRKARGTGLGLAIVKALVEMQGGRVSVESRVGHGSTFTVTVPAAK